MQSLTIRSVFFICCTCILFSCNPTKRTQVNDASSKITSLKFLGEYDIPYALKYANTTIGGLSGIDYNIRDNLYYFICDDRSAINPARFYTAQIIIENGKIDTVLFTTFHSFLQANGEVYPNSKQDPTNTPDPESIRYNSSKDQLLWSSEGERNIKDNDTILSNPAIRLCTTDGKYIDSFTLPLNLHMSASEKGPRQNSVFEGLSFADNYKTLFVSVEEPLYEDGPRANTEHNNPYIRILKYDVSSRKNISQYAYKLDPVAYPANPVSAYKINGVPEILAIDNERLLVIERSFSTGHLACVIKVFITSLQEATDIINIPSLKENDHFKAAQKKLLLNMNDLGIYIDNIEGVTFGPLLPNGHKTLLFVADNNFNPLEKTQILLFEID